VGPTADLDAVVSVKYIANLGTTVYELRNVYTCKFSLPNVFIIINVPDHVLRR
jgi:hypothetical protein